jgi:hypothetical protein
MAGRVLLVQGSSDHDVFEVVELTDVGAKVRTAFLFEVGEELSVKIDQKELVARVVGHSGPADAKITELELVPA